MTKLFSKIAVSAAALSLAAGPAMAQNAASKLSLRASTKAKNSSEIAPPIIALIGLAAIIGGGIYIAVDDDSPDSP